MTTYEIIQFIPSCTVDEGSEQLDQYCRAVFSELLARADQGDCLAMHHVGFLYSVGMGADHNFPLALKWLERAFNCGHHFSANNLWLYCVDSGENDKAVYWYRKMLDTRSQVAALPDRARANGFE